MNHIGTQYWPMRLQPSDYCEIMISCQVCWRMRRWHNGRTRRSPNPKSEIVLCDCSVNGEESAAHSILARSDPLQQRPYTFAQTNLWRLQISLAARRRTIHFDRPRIAHLEQRPRHPAQTRSCANSSGASSDEDWLPSRGTPDNVLRTDRTRPYTRHCSYISIRTP